MCGELVECETPLVDPMCGPPPELSRSKPPMIATQDFRPGLNAHVCMSSNGRAPTSPRGPGNSLVEPMPVRSADRSHYRPADPVPADNRDGWDSDRSGRKRQPTEGRQTGPESRLTFISRVQPISGRLPVGKGCRPPGIHEPPLRCSASSGLRRRQESLCAARYIARRQIQWLGSPRHASPRTRPSKRRRSRAR